MQLSFSQLWPDHAGRLYANDVDARCARDMAYRIARKMGVKASRWSLPGSVRPYAAFGVPDGRSCTVYYLNIIKS